MKYYLVHNEVDIFYYGEILEEQEIKTGQPFLEFFYELTDLENRLSNFGIVCIKENNIIEDTYFDLPDEI